MSLTSLYRLPSTETNRTILDPQDSRHADCNSVFAHFVLLDDEEIKQLQKKFYWKSICFTLSVVTIFRFPKELLQQENKALYAYLFIFYSIIFGLPILMFEMAAGHFYTKGFASLFSFSPIFQGISISMVGCCIIACLYYSFINVYSLHYFFLSFTPLLSYTYNGNVTTGNYTDTSEYKYFSDYVSDGFDVNGNVTWYGITLYTFLWFFMFLALFFIITKYHIVTMFISCYSVLSVVFTTTACLAYHNFSRSSFKAVYIPSGDFSQVSVWIEPLEQVFLSFGFGLGPLLTYWSFANFRIWSHKYCILIFIVTLSSTLCSAFINFSGEDMEAFKITEEVSVFPLHGYLFNGMGVGFSNALYIIFYLMMSLNSFFIIMECSKIIIAFVRSYITTKQVSRFCFLSGLCLVLFTASYNCYLWGTGNLKISIDNIFFGPATLFIVFCEVTSVMYFYGVNNFCDDIDFLLGYYPNFFYQIIWRLCPIFTLIYFVCSVYLKYERIKDNEDLVSFLLIFLMVIGPIIGVFLFKCASGIKNKNLMKQLNVRAIDDLRLE